MNHGDSAALPGRNRDWPTWTACVLIVTCLLNCWLWMQIVHESGHVLAGWLSGGSLACVVLHPLRISRTDLSHNPHALAVCWAGPIVGCLLPLAGWLLFPGRTRWTPWAVHLRFFAGFCLIANGAYLSVGAFPKIGDAGDLLRLGTAPWMLYGFGVLTIPAGLVLWNGLGPHFGLGLDRRPVPRALVISSIGLLAITVVLELIFHGVFEIE